MDHLPLSAEQEQARAAGLNVVLLASLHGRVDVPRLRAALDRVVERHEALRSRVAPVEGYRGLRQWPVATASVRWSVVEGEDAVAQMEIEAATPFDLHDGRLVRARLCRESDTLSHLVLCASSLSADGASLETMLDELLLACAGGEPQAEPLQYRQFIEWRQALADGDEGAQGRAYWAGLDLHAVRAPRLPARTQGEGGAVCSIDEALADDAAQALSHWAASRGVALETVLQAAWWALLARISSETAWLGGWRHDCRRDYDMLAGTVGVFERTLPVPVRIDIDAPFDAWLVRLDQALQAHRAWQESCPADAPAASVGFACTTVPLPREHAGLRAEVLRRPLPGGFELVAEPVLGDGRVQRVALHHTPAHHAREDAACLLRQYLALLAALPQHAHQPVAELPIADDGWTFEGPVLDVGSAALPQVLLSWARSTPDVPALAGGGVTLSYAALGARVDRLARALVQRGAAGRIVALILPRSVDSVVALLAVMRAGAAYLPLDPAWPEERRRKIVADAQPVLVVDDATVHALEQESDETTPLPDVALAQPAYVLYTSGSTGEPKGVVIAHRQLLNYMAASGRALSLDACRRFALTSTVAADLGNTCLFGAFFHGACLVVADAHDMQDAASFARFIQHEAIDCLKIVPSHLDALLDADATALPHTLVLGGETTPRALVDRIRHLAPRCRVFNHYGPTETTVGVMVHAADACDADVLPLTQALANCRIRLLDERLRPVPSGALGEVFIGGAQLCEGALNRPALFVDDPFLPGERLYRSGDLARRGADGRLVLVGRADHQVKIRGFRVDPAEVEAVLQAVPGVRQAAVRAWGERGDMRLCAYVVADAALQDDGLAQALAQRLPEPMRPHAIQRLDALPRLPNGKIDRLALAPPQAAAAAHVAPRDALERLLAHLCAELLGREQVSVTDSFFDLGGHSLLVIKLVARIRKQLQADIPPGTVFDHPSVAALAQALRAREAKPGELQKLAELRLQLASMTAEQRAALRAQAQALTT